MNSLDGASSLNTTNPSIYHLKFLSDDIKDHEEKNEVPVNNEVCRFDAILIYFKELNKTLRSKINMNKGVINPLFS